MNSQQFCIGVEQVAAAKRKTTTELQSESCQKLKKNQLLKHRYTHTQIQIQSYSYSHSCSYKRHLVISSNFVVFICLRCAFSLSSSRRQMKPAGDEAFGIRYSVFSIGYSVFGIWHQWNLVYNIWFRLVPFLQGSWALAAVIMCAPFQKRKPLKKG